MKHLHPVADTDSIRSKVGSEFTLAEDMAKMADTFARDSIVSILDDSNQRLVTVQESAFGENDNSKSLG